MTASIAGDIVEPTGRRCRGFPSEQHFKRGLRIVHGDKELIREVEAQ
jgi:hypothetical protein